MNIKTLARLAVSQEVLKGRIPRASELKCKHCEGPACSYHHDDYEAPLDVVPVCNRCHVLVHNQKRKERMDELRERNPHIKYMTATELNKGRGIYYFLEILEKYESIVVVRHGEEKLVIHRPDALLAGFESDDAE